MGIAFKRSDNITKETEILFEDGIVDSILSEINVFWQRREVYEKYDITYKRGFLFHGPPGTGKSVLLRMIAKRLVDQYNGVVIFWRDLMKPALEILRSIEPQRSVAIIMEDIDEILEYDESEILNMLDGIEESNGVVYLATTNKIDTLDPRVSNRPSRFDRRVLVDTPDSNKRKQFLKSFQEREPELSDETINKWVATTDDFSLAHLRELFVSVYVLGVPFDEACDTVRNMIIEEPKGEPEDIDDEDDGPRGE
jgi:SpoVK/Ycf46/Vps4 family AAA+-type ATPase